ncbi:Asp-tRNA(Asn)/Glu-tRNA(Gln) amidotransferase subunit GatA [Leeia aquatica]|uniref:Glutamyl-tRNA(Gln) amidotransferase subunit A n=1 Tax=Leeia aquatica TaxID=2725557 RepID=A0A847S011_9NEIS|nr:Asp-tRNA(Asn)/Glu-tRNA(Gln) amidotransferase subunit GatA [Leeia aquatica]NLR76690.1 Asp-tRNA(Asn)/Glu-tRNA(Gln) amidotransferase subunit GatA [Leeia aquatica]
MHTHTLTQLSAALATGQVSSVELTQHYLDRIQQLDPQFNSFITLDTERSLAEARAADARRAAGHAGPLTGIPLAHKDIYVAEGWRSTCGSRMLENFVSPYDATVVARCKDAGMVTLGKLNCDEFAMGSSNENSHFGPVKNPWDTQAVPGGSSGGSAAAVAARLTPIATGTDTGGSIRQPASFCGITGIKPTYGVVSRYGMVAYASSFDQGGPMARSAEDCAHLLNVMAGFDERDSTSLKRPAEDYTRDLNQPLAGLRIGLPKEYFGDGLDSEVAATVQAAVEQFRQLGATVKEVSLPRTRMAIPTYYILAPAEASSNLSRFDGVRYGHRAAEYGDLADMYERSRSEGFGAEVKRRILTGTYVLSHGYYDAYYIKAQKVRRLIADDFQRAFADCDVIMGPAAPTAAFDLGSRSNDPLQMYLEDVYTLSPNLAGLPAMSIPAGFNRAGRPIGLQIIGNYFSEARMLGLAHQFQLNSDWHQQQPGSLA